MKNNKIIGIVVVILVIIGGIYLVMKNQAAPAGIYATGTVIASISDKTADLSALSEIDLTITSMSLHNEAMGWVTVSSTPHTYNLLDLNAKNESKVFADFQIATGTYDMARLKIDSIIIKTKTGTLAAAKVPSGELQINTVLNVNNGTSTINFEFLADHSLHLTGEGKYIFTPVVKTTTRSNTDAEIKSDETVKISNGKVDDEGEDGMDIDGEVKANFEVDANEKLDIENDEIKIHVGSTTLKVIND